MFKPDFVTELFPPINLQRTVPASIDVTRKPLYKAILSTWTRSVQYKIMYNVHVKSELFIKHFFKIRTESFGDDWQDKVYNRPLYLLKNAIKNLFRKKSNIPECVWVLDQYSTGGFAHWIIDICPRIWLASKYIDPSIPLLFPEYLVEKYPFGVAFLAVFDRKIIYFKSDTVCYINQMHFISQAGGFMNFHPSIVPPTVALIQQYYIKNIPVKPSKSVFISRKYTPKRKIVNEYELEPILVRYGVQIVYLEEMSIADEVQLFSNVHCVISIHGAGLTNMVYMTPGSKVLEITNQFPSQMFLLFPNLAQLFKLQYFVLEAEACLSEGIQPQDLDVKVHPENFEKMLQTVL